MKNQDCLKDIFKYYCSGHPNIKKFWKKKSQELVDKYDLEEVNKHESEEEKIKIKSKTHHKKEENKFLNKKKKKEESDSECQSESDIENTIPIKPKNENITINNGSTSKVPFKRIADSLKEVLPASLQDNSYESFMNSTGENYGKQANEKLKVTKGRDFKREKTKFKNKTAFGGLNISTQVRSIKLDEDSD